MVRGLGVLEIFSESRDLLLPDGAVGEAAGGNDRARAAAGGALTMRPLGRCVRDRVGQPAALHHQLLAQRAQFQPEGLDVGRFGVTDGFGTVGREIEQAIRDGAEERFLADDVGDWRKAIEAHPVNGKAVASAERGKRLAAITRQRAALEQREEAVLLGAERDGLELDRRADASPAVVVCTVLAEDAAA